MALALASRVLDIPLPDDLAATGTLSAHGDVGAVEGLALKIRCLEKAAPSIRRLLVCVSNEEEAVGFAQGSLDVIPVATLTEAFATAFEGRMTDALIGHAHSPEDVARLAHAIFLMTLYGRQAAHVWAPVRAAAETLLDRCKPTSEEVRYKLVFASAVASRYDHKCSELQPPTPEMLSTLPMPLRYKCVSHLVQHAADCGSPSPSAVRALADQHLCRDLLSTEGDLRLMGALGRLEAAEGNPRRDLEIQIQVAERWIEIGVYDEVTYALAEWYRVAGALNDLDAFNSADRCARRTGGDSSLYVRAARAKSGAWLGLDAEEISRTLAIIRDSPHAHLLMKLATLRVSLLVETDPQVRATLLGQLAGGATVGGAQLLVQLDDIVRRYQLLVQLDDGVRAGDGEAAGAALDALTTLEPARLERLRAAGARYEGGEAEYVQRFYPY